MSLEKQQQNKKKRIFWKLGTLSFFFCLLYFLAVGNGLGFLCWCLLGEEQNKKIGDPSISVLSFPWPLCSWSFFVMFHQLRVRWNGSANGFHVYEKLPKSIRIRLQQKHKDVNVFSYLCSSSLLNSGSNLGLFLLFALLFGSILLFSAFIILRVI